MNYLMSLSLYSVVDHQWHYVNLMNKLKPQHEDYNLVLVAWKMLSNWLIMTVSSSASCHMPAYKAAIYIYNLEPLNVTVMSWMLT